MNRWGRLIPSNELILVYDIAESGFQAWWLLLPVLLYLVIGILLVGYTDKVIEFFAAFGTRYGPRYTRAFGFLFALFGLYMTVTSITSAYGDYADLVEAYQNGNHTVHQGIVFDYRTAGTDGQRYDTFRINEAKFTLSGDPTSSGYRKTFALGSPIDEGGRIRLLSVGKTIVRLEATQEAVSRGERRLETTIYTNSQSRRDFVVELTPVFALFWLLMIAMVFGLAAMWRWRARPYIAADPSLLEGYNRLITGFIFWGNMPFAVLALCFALGYPLDMGVIGMPGYWTPAEIAFLGSLVLIDILWVYWTFFADGISKLVDHPGLIDQPWLAKFLPPFAIGIHIVVIFGSRSMAQLN